eukprot:2878423-Pyramimonas_sp.AAC.1
MSRWGHDPAPGVAENGPADTNSEHKARLCKHLVHEHGRNTVHFPDHSEVRQWAISRGRWVDTGADVLSSPQYGTGRDGWATPATP